MSNMSNMNIGQVTGIGDQSLPAKQSETAQGKAIGRGHTTQSRPVNSDETRRVSEAATRSFSQARTSEGVSDKVIRNVSKFVLGVATIVVGLTSSVGDLVSTCKKCMICAKNMLFPSKTDPAPAPAQRTQAELVAANNDENAAIHAKSAATAHLQHAPDYSEHNYNPEDDRESESDFGYKPVDTSQIKWDDDAMHDPKWKV